MFQMTRIKSYNRLIIGLIVTEVVIRQFVPIGGVILMGILSLVLFILIKKIYGGKFHKPNMESVIPLFMLFLLCVIQFITSGPQIKAIIQAWILFFSLFCFSNYNITFISSIKKGAYIISLLGAVSILSLNGFSVMSSNMRDEMLIDKGMLTIWFSLTLCFSFIDSMVKGIKNFSTLIFVFILLVNLVVVQSKTCILAFVIFLGFFIVLSKQQIHKRLLRYMIPLLIVYGVLIFSNPTEYIPHTFIVALNQVVGSDVIPVYTDKFDMGTYDSRELIDIYCTKLFFENPIVGIGLGNYELLPTLPTGVTECENTYFDLLVNGGLLYGAPVIYILFITLVRNVKLIWKSTNIVEYYYILGILISMIVSFRYNDFLNISVFMFIGSCYYFCKINKNFSIFQQLDS